MAWVSYAPVPDPIAAVDHALRALSPAALRRAGLDEHAARVEALPGLTVANAYYASASVHHAFVSARRLAHTCAATGDRIIAALAAYCACVCHASADGCAAIAMSGSPSGGLFLAAAQEAAKNAWKHYQACADAGGNVDTVRSLGYVASAFPGRGSLWGSGPDYSNSVGGEDRAASGDVLPTP